MNPNRDATAGRGRAGADPASTATSEAGLLRLEQRLAYRFRHRQALAQALTHRSCRREVAGGLAATLDDNERFEFLGDAVLGLRASERLLALYPHASEGELSRMRAWLVSARHLAEVAERLELGGCLRMSRAEEALGGRGKQRLLANAFEAVIAAVFLDGGYVVAGDLIDRLIMDAAPEAFSSRRVHEFGYKSALQEWAHATDHPLPTYRIVSATGPEHGKVFTVLVEIPEVVAATATAHSKKEAEQLAARAAMERLELPGVEPSEPRADPGGQ